MAVSRELLRLWIVLSACWVIGVGAFTWYTLPVDDWVVVAEEKIPSFNDMVDESRRDAQGQTPLPPLAKPPFDPNKPYAVDQSNQRIERIKTGAVLAFAPPLVVLVLGVAFAWVVRGFRQKA